MVARIVPAVVLVVAGLFLFEALKLPFGSAARPGAGFFPVIVAAFACLVGLIAIVQGFLAAPAADEADTVGLDERARRRVAITTVAVIGFCFAMPWTGYPLAAAGFVLVTLRGLGSRVWSAATIAIVSALGSHYLFAQLLDVPLPRGPW